MSAQNQPKRRRKPILSGCGCVVGIPVLALVALWLVFLFNNRPPDIVIPRNPLPANNGFDEVVRAGRMLQAIPHKAPASMPVQPAQSQMFAACEACSKDATPGLAIVRGALDKPFMWPSMRSATGPGFDELAIFRGIERVITGDAEYHLRSGHSGRAADSLLDGLELGVMVPRGGGVIHCLVGIACNAIAIHNLAPILPQLSGSELKKVAARLDRIAAKRVTFGDIMAEEAQIAAALTLEDIRTRKSYKAKYDELRESLGVPEDKWPTLQEGWMMVRNLMADKTKILKDYKAYEEALAREARGPFLGPSKIPFPQGLAALGMPAPPFDNSRSTYEASSAMIELLRAQVALYRYRTDHGRYPETLQGLVPAYLKSVPIDPCGGGASRPFKYSAKNREQSFLLYSFGADVTDNGGKPARTPTQIGGDIVAGSLWQKKRPGK